MISVPNAVKNLYHNDHAYKNIRIHFPNGERSDICNDLIVKDSVSFKESLCSQNKLKFGLCESPIFECEVVGVGNIKGATIEVSIEIECPSTVLGAEWRVDLQKNVYSIPYGIFVVDECNRQADLNHRKIKAYVVGINGYFARNPFIYLAQNVFLDSQQTTYTIDLATLACCLSNVKQSNSLIESTTQKTLSQEYNTEIYYSSKLYSNHRIMLGVAVLDNYQIPYNERDHLFYMKSSPYIASSITEYFDTIDRFTEKYELDVKNTRKFDISSVYNSCFHGGFLTPDHPDLLVRELFPIPNFSFICPKLDLAYEEQIYNNYNLHPRLACIKEIIITVYEGYGSNPEILEQARIPVRDSENPFEVYEVAFKDDIFRNSISVQRLPYNQNFILDKSFDFSAYLSAYIELLGMFCGWKRDGYNFVNIARQFGLNPQTSLYPSTNLYPQNVTGGKLFPQDYQSCWYDDVYTKKYGAIYCEFKTVETIEETQKVVDSSYTMYLNGFDETSDPSLYEVYEIKGNKIISDKVAVIESGEVKLVDKTWTPQQIESICEVIAANLDGVQYIPVNFEGRGLPYVEAGDTFEILTKSNDSITTIVLNRTIKGEQTLKDSYKSV